MTKKGTSKKGWKKHPVEHNLARQGIKTAGNYEKGRPVTFDPTQSMTPTMQGSGKWEEKQESLQEAYLDELHDILNESVKQHRRDEITEEELGRRQELGRISSNYIENEGKYMSNDELADVMRHLKYALEDKNKEIMFYYIIGKEEKGADYGY